MTKTESLREAIKEQVLEIRQYLLNTEFAPEPFTKPVDVETLTVEFPSKILHLCKEHGLVFVEKEQLATLKVFGWGKYIEPLEIEDTENETNLLD